MKRSSYVLAVLIFAICFIAVLSFSAAALENEIFTYSISNDEVTISGLTEYGKTLPSLTVPDTIDSLPVTLILKISSTALESIAIPGSVKELRSNCFYRCSALTTVTFLNVGLEKIGSGAFKECPLLQSINIPVGTKYIENAAFSGCKKLSDIDLPDTVKYIGSEVFYNTAKYNSFMNSTDKALYIGKHLIKVKNNSHDDYGVLEGTLTIAKEAYMNCTRLKTLYIPLSVRNICYYAFYGCTALENVIIYSDFANIQPYAFTNTAIVNNAQNYEDGLLYIDKYLYTADNSITIANIKEGTVGICAKALEGCNKLTSIVIPDSTKIVGEYAFPAINSSLKDIYLGSGLEYIDYQNFTTVIERLHIKSIKDWLEIEFCSADSRPNYDSFLTLYINGEVVKDVVIPEDIELKPGMFYHIKGIESIVIPQTATTIPNNTFRQATNLKYIVIPSSLTSIENKYEFLGTSVTHVFYTGDAEQLNALVSNVSNLNTAIKVPNATPKTVNFVTNCDDTIDASYGYYVKKPVTPTKAYHSFIGWYEDESFTHNAVTFPYYGNAATLYARWAKTTVNYSITDKDNAVYSVEIPLEYPAGSKVVAVLYGENGIADIKITDFSAVQHSITTDKSIVGVKILIFESFASLKPLCTPFVIGL